jgi:hypothetical protein
VKWKRKLKSEIESEVEECSASNGRAKRRLEELSGIGRVR